MTPDDYITKAIHALRTEQPNLAMLYMKRGYTEMRRLRKDPEFDLRVGIAAFTEALNEIGVAFETAARAMFKAFEPIAKIYTGYWTQDDFALVADV